MSSPSQFYDKLIVVIPTYNEANNIEAITTALLALGYPNLSILIVDDDSPDGTGDIANRIQQENPGKFSVIHRKGKRGFGSAYIAGFQHALAQEPEVIIQMDADFSHSPTYIPYLLDTLNDADLVIGSRYVPGGSLDEKWGAGRRFLSWFGNFYSRLILGMNIRDVTGGFRVWRKTTLENIPLESIRSEGYVFQVEMAYVATRLGFALAEYPIYFEDRRIGQSKMSLRIQLEAALRVWQVRFLHGGLKPLDLGLFEVGDRD
jgi:dolichol-phosphate mannosyltransferase